MKVSTFSYSWAPRDNLEIVGKLQKIDVVQQAFGSSPDSLRSPIAALLLDFNLAGVQGLEHPPQPFNSWSIVISLQVVFYLRTSCTRIIQVQVSQ